MKKPPRIGRFSVFLEVLRGCLGGFQNLTGIMGGSIEKRPRESSQGRRG
jgi:hypothetical protein